MTERRVTGVMAILTCCARAPCLFDQPSCRSFYRLTVGEPPLSAAWHHTHAKVAFVREKKKTEFILAQTLIYVPDVTAHFFFSLSQESLSSQRCRAWYGNERSRSSSIYKKLSVICQKGRALVLSSRAVNWQRQGSLCAYVEPAHRCHLVCEWLIPV